MYQSFSNQPNHIGSTSMSNSIVNTANNGLNGIIDNIKVEQPMLGMQFNANTQPNFHMTGGSVPIHGKRSLSLPINNMDSTGLQLLPNTGGMQGHFGTKSGNQGLMMNMPPPKRPMMCPPNGGGGGMRMVGRNRAQEMMVKRNLQMSLLNKVAQNQMQMNRNALQNSMQNPFPMTFDNVVPGSNPLAYANSMPLQKDARSMNVSSLDWNTIPPGVKGNQQVPNAALLNAMKAEKMHSLENPSLSNAFLFSSSGNASQLQGPSMFTPANMIRNKCNEPKYDVNVNVTVNVNGAPVVRPSTVPIMYQNQSPRNALSQPDQQQHTLTLQNTPTQLPISVQNSLKNAMTMSSRSGSNMNGSSLVGECVNCHKLVVSTELKVVCADCEREEVQVIKNFLKTNIFNDNDEEDAVNSREELFEKTLSNNREKDGERVESVSSASSVLTRSPCEEMRTTVKQQDSHTKLPLDHQPLSSVKFKMEPPQTPTSPTMKMLPSLPETPEHPSKDLRGSPLQFPLDPASSLVSDLFAISKLGENQDIEVKDTSENAEGGTCIQSTGNSDARDGPLNKVINDVDKEPDDLRLIGDLSPPSPTNIMCSWNADETLITDDIINLVAQENTKALGGSENLHAEQNLILSSIKGEEVKFSVDNFPVFDEDDL